MGVTIAATRAAVNTATGTQSFTTSDLGGLTPKAAIMIGSFALTDGTEGDHAVSSFGVTDGTTSRVHVATSEDGQADTDCSSDNEGYCVQFITPGETTNIGRGVFDSWTTNGIVIDWTTAPTSAWLLTVILFAGTDLTAKVGETPSLGDTVDSTTDVTNVGFEADCLINFNVEVGATYHYVQLGIVSNDRASGISQRVIGVPWVSNQAEANVQIVNNDSYGIMETATADKDWYGEYSDFDSSGYSITTRNSGGNNRTVWYLALRFGATRAIQVKVLTHSTPAGTGDDSETGVGFKPQALFLINTLSQGSEKQSSPPECGVYGFSVITANAQYCTTYTCEEGPATSQTTSLSTAQSFDINEDDGVSTEIVGTHVSFDTNGWTTNYSKTTSGCKQYVLAFEEEAAAADIVEPIIRPKMVWPGPPSGLFDI